jgi:hypothetical protein
MEFISFLIVSTLLAWVLSFFTPKKPIQQAIAPAVEKKKPPESVEYENTHTFASISTLEDKFADESIPDYEARRAEAISQVTSLVNDFVELDQVNPNLAESEMREQIGNLVRVHGHDINQWIGELTHRNIGVEDDVDRITGIMIRFARYQPWTISDEDIHILRTFQRRSAPVQDAQGRWRLNVDRRDLDDIVRQARITNLLDTSSDDIWLLECGSQLHVRSEEAEALDMLLGVAGFVPMDDHETLQDHIEEWKRHVHIRESPTNTLESWMKVSYSCSSLMSRESSHELAHILDISFNAFTYFVAAIQRIEHRTSIGDGIVYLHHMTSSPDQLEDDDTDAVTVRSRSASLDDISRLAQVFQKYKALRREIMDQIKRDKDEAIMTWLLELLPFLTNILEPLGVIKARDNAYSALDMIHFLSLTVQMLCMAVQLDVIEPTSSLWFKRFLDHGMARICLKGIEVESRKSIYLVPVKFPRLGGVKAFSFTVSDRMPVVPDEGLTAVSLSTEPSHLLRIFGSSMLAIAPPTDVRNIHN